MIAYIPDRIAGEEQGREEDSSSLNGFAFQPAQEKVHGDLAGFFARLHETGKVRDNDIADIGVCKTDYRNVIGNPEARLVYGNYRTHGHKIGRNQHGSGRRLLAEFGDQL